MTVATATPPADPAAAAAQYPSFHDAGRALALRMVYGAVRDQRGRSMRSRLPAANVYRRLEDGLGEFAHREQRRWVYADTKGAFEERFPEASNLLQAALAIGGYPVVPPTRPPQEPLTFIAAKDALAERMAYNGSWEAGSPSAAARRGLVMSSVYRHLQALGVPPRSLRTARGQSQGTDRGRVPRFNQRFPEREALLRRALALGGYPAYCPVGLIEVQLELPFNLSAENRTAGARPAGAEGWI